MGQISIPMSNKVGYSMYWNSMWDNKINYTRSLKEDIYLNRFILLVFEDCISSKIIKFYNKNYSTAILNKYNFHTRIPNKNEFNRYLTKINKITFYSSRLWILKYQKWIILYFYIYLPTFNRLKIKINLVEKNTTVSDNIYNLYNFYLKANFKLNFSFNFFKNQVKKNCF